LILIAFLDNVQHVWARAGLVNPVSEQDWLIRCQRRTG